MRMVSGPAIVTSTLRVNSFSFDIRPPVAMGCLLGTLYQMAPAPSHPIFVDACDARVAIHPLERELARVAVAAEDLDALVDGPRERFARPHLVDRALGRKPL